MCLTEMTLPDLNKLWMKKGYFMDTSLASHNSGMSDFGLSRDQHVDFIFAIYSAYYNAFE